MKLTLIALVFAFPVQGAFAQDGDAGALLYAGSCAGCHGAKADGKGPAADVFKIEVPPLNNLAVRNNGEFPMLEVVHVIDGRTGLRGHEGVMPVFGSLFSNEKGRNSTDFITVIETNGRILSIALYLESIQQ